MNRILLFVLLFMVAGYANSQPAAHKLTLQDAIDLAKAQSPDALISKQMFRASFYDYKSFRSSYYPALWLDAVTPQYTSGWNMYTESTGAQTYVYQQYLYANANLSLRQQIGLTGGTISLNSNLEGTRNFTTIPGDSNLLTMVSQPITISYTQPLFKYNPYKWDRKIKPLEYSQSKKKYLEDIEQICIKTTEAFFTLLNAQIDKQISNINLHNYDTLYQIAKGRYELGKIAENDLLLLELNFLRAQAALENANLNLENAMFKFKSFLRIKDTIPVELVPPSKIDFFKIDPQTAIEQANENSSSALDFKKRLYEAARDVYKAKMDNRFDADLTASYGIMQKAYGFPDVYSNPDNKTDNTQLYLKLSIPILDWGQSRSQIKIAQAQEEIVKNEVEQGLIDFERSVYLKAVQFNMQQNQVRIAAKSDTVAQKTYDVTKGRYLIGKINSILDLYNAQIENDNAQKGYYDALQTFWRSYFEIRKMTLYDFRENQQLQFNIKDIKL